MIGAQIGPYKVEAELGTGGMGTVYRATGPDGVVALKAIHPHLLESPGYFKRFLREAEIGRTIDLFVRGSGVFSQQVRRRHDLAGLTVPALRHVDVVPSDLHRVGAIRRQPLDGGDLGALEPGDR